MIRAQDSLPIPNLKRPGGAPGSPETERRRAYTKIDIKSYTIILYKFSKKLIYALTSKTAVDIINDKLEIIVYKHAGMLKGGNDEQNRF